MHQWICCATCGRPWLVSIKALIELGVNFRHRCGECIKASHG